MTQLTALLGQFGQVLSAIPLVALLHGLVGRWASVRRPGSVRSRGADAGRGQERPW